MNHHTETMMYLWEQARTRFSNQLEDIQNIDLSKKLHPAVNSIGFLIRHIADVELLFAKNIFGESNIAVSAKTVIAKKDTGEWSNQKELKEYSNRAYITLKQAILNQDESDWSQFVETKEFGRKTKAEALGRIISHTAYHAGQLALINKYGN